MLGDVRVDRRHLGDVMALRGRGIGQVSGQVGGAMRAGQWGVGDHLVDLVGREERAMLTGMDRLAAPYRGMYEWALAHRKAPKNAAVLPPL
jgi:hypothetical protein